MTSFAFQVGEPNEDPNSELKAVDFFDPETVGVNAIPDSNDNTTITAMLEALDKNIFKAQRVLKQIKGTGKVSRSMMMETVDFYEELDTVPIKFYTEAPTAQLGEPTVESLSKWLAKAGTQAAEIIERIWKFIARYIKMASQYGVNFLRKNTEKENIKKMNSIVWPNSLTESQVQVLNDWATAQNYGSFMSAFWNFTKSKEDRSLDKKYIKDFMSGTGIFTNRIHDFVADKDLAMIVTVLSDVDRLQDLFSYQADTYFASVLDKMDSLKKAIDNAPEMQVSDFGTQSESSDAMLSFFKNYIAKRDQDVKSGKGIVTNIESVQSLLRKLNRFDSNISRIRGKIESVLTEENDEGAISRRVSEVRDLISFVTMLQQHCVGFGSRLLDSDKAILKVPVMLEKALNDESESSDMKSEFRKAYQALSLSIEDANIISYSNRNDSSLKPDAASGSIPTTQQLKDWFSRIIQWIKQAINSAKEFYSRLKSNIPERLMRLVLRLNSSGFKTSWGKFKQVRTSQPLFEETLKNATANIGKELTTRGPNFVEIIHDLTFGKFTIAKTILKTKEELPAMTQTLNKLGDIFREMEKDSSPEAVIRYLHEFDPGKNASSFVTVKTIIDQTYRETNSVVANRLGKAGTASIVPTEPAAFVAQGDLLYTNFEEARSVAKKLSDYVKELQYLWSRNKVDDLFYKFSDLASDAQKEAIGSGQTSPERVEALRKMMTFLTTFLEMVRYVISVIDIYILNTYITYSVYDTVITNIMNSADMNKNTAFSKENLDSMTDGFVDPAQAVQFPIESELAIETYLDQGEDSYEQQMSDSGGQQQASYLTQAADAQMENTEEQAEEDPYKAATEKENDNPDIAEDTDKAVTDPVLTEVLVGEGDSSQDINDALGRLNEACELAKKVEDSEGVTRELAMEGYEHFPLAMGNPTNYIKGKVYVDERQASLESLNDTIKQKAQQAYEWLKKVAVIVADKIEALYERVRRFAAQYNESGVVKQINAVKNEPMADASAFESDEILAQLKKMCVEHVRDNKFVSQVLLMNPGSLHDHDMNFDKIIRQSSAIRDVMKSIAQGQGVEGASRQFDIPGLARLVNEVTFSGRRVDVTDQSMQKALERYRMARPAGSYANVISRYEKNLSALSAILKDVKVVSAKVNGVNKPNNIGVTTEESEVINSVARTINLLSTVATRLDIAIRFIMAFDRATLHSVKIAQQGEQTPEQTEPTAA